MLSRQRRDESKGKRGNGRQRGKKGGSDEDSNESDGNNSDGDDGNVGGDSGKSQTQRRRRMGEKEGNVCFRNYEVGVMKGSCG